MKSRNIRFLEKYILLESVISRRMPESAGALSAYINALEGQKLDTGAAKTLLFLKKCRAIRNRLSHTPGAIKGSVGVTCADIRRLGRLIRDIENGKDPLSKKEAARMRERIAVLCLIAILAIAFLITANT